MCGEKWPGPKEFKNRRSSSSASAHRVCLRTSSDRVSSWLGCSPRAAGTAAIRCRSPRPRTRASRSSSAAARTRRLVRHARRGCRRPPRPVAQHRQGDQPRRGARRDRSSAQVPGTTARRRPPDRIMSVLPDRSVRSVDLRRNCIPAGLFSLRTFAAGIPFRRLATCRASSPCPRPPSVRRPPITGRRPRRPPWWRPPS